MKIMAMGTGDTSNDLAGVGTAAAPQLVPAERWARLGSVVMLAGSVRAGSMRKATGRSVIELPVTSGHTVLDCWSEELSDMALLHELKRLRVRVMVDRAVSLPHAQQQRGPLDLSIEQDPSEYRGTAGLLHDLAEQYGDDEYMVVVHGSQLLFHPLHIQVEAMLRSGADISLVCSRDGTPAGVMLLRCGCLRKINKVGFVDLNEQALPKIAGSHDVRVVRFDQRTAMSLRTRSRYIETLTHYHRRHAGRLEGPGAGEQWRPTFGIVEPGASVHERAVVHDSVVLGGARVESGAVLVRSIVCPGAVVGREQRVIDDVVAASARNPAEL